MTTRDNTVLLTTQELLAIPNDGTKRELSRGRMRERGCSMGGRAHSRTAVCLTAVLAEWLAGRPFPRGEVLVGGATFRLARDPDTTIETDVAYVSPVLAESTDCDAEVFEGLPTLVVEIVSPRDVQQHISEMVGDCLAAGVPLVWLVEPVFETITVYRPGRTPEMFNVDEEIDCEPHMPGFRARVAEVFGE